MLKLLHSYGKVIGKGNNLPWIVLSKWFESSSYFESHVFPLLIKGGKVCKEAATGQTQADKTSRGFPWELRARVLCCVNLPLPSPRFRGLQGSTSHDLPGNEPQAVSSHSPHSSPMARLQATPSPDTDTLLGTSRSQQLREKKNGHIPKSP